MIKSENETKIKSTFDEDLEKEEVLNQQSRQRSQIETF